jgi:glyoxalase family protein
MLLTPGFHHVTLVARDARATRVFYERMLGFRLVKQTVNFDDPGSYHLYFGDSAGAPGTIVTFFEWPTSARGRYGIGGIHHHAFGTASRDTLLMWKRWLTDQGMRVNGPRDRGYFTSLYFRDPDGQVLEIATRGPGYAIDEPIDALGRSDTQPSGSQLPGGRDEAAIAAETWPEPVPAIADAMRLWGLHHVTGITDDLVRAGEFYEATLGLRLVKRSVNQDDPGTPHYFWANYDTARVLAGSSLTMFGWPAHAQRAQAGVGQTHHIAFRAPDEETQLAWRDHLLAIGVNVSPVMDRVYFQSIYFQAPDGLLMEIATDGPGFGVDEPVASLGSGLQLPPWLESSRAEITSTLRPLTAPLAREPVGS